MTRPVHPFQAQAKKLLIILKKQTWLLLVIIMSASIVDITLQISNFATSKNILAGGLLAWFGQFIFTKISLKKSGYRFRRQIVNNLYLAQLLKWLITLIGFAIIFLYLKPLKPLWVFIGFFILQLGHIIGLYYYNSK